MNNEATTPAPSRAEKEAEVRRYIGGGQRSWSMDAKAAEFFCEQLDAERARTDATKGELATLKTAVRWFFLKISTTGCAHFCARLLRNEEGITCTHAAVLLAVTEQQ